jgi:fibrillarin-like pre-rRNA processing protein
LVAAFKSRSEDVTADPAVVFDRLLGELDSGYEILASERLEPYHDDHLAVVATPNRG